jgi:hypothetical protein
MKCRNLGTHSGGYEERHLAGHNALLSVESQPGFRRNFPTPFSGRKNKHTRKAAWLCLPPALTLICCSAYHSTPNMEAKYFYETPVDLQRTTLRYVYAV